MSLIYLSHAITFADNIGTEPQAITSICDVLEKLNIKVFRPLMHNPWNNFSSVSPIDIEEARANAAKYIHTSRLRRHTRAPRVERDIRDKYLDIFKNKDGHGAKYIVDVDISVIKSSDMVIALLNPPSIGGAMEIVYACQNSIPVIGVVAGDEEMPNVSKWAIEHCSKVFHIDGLDMHTMAKILKVYDIRSAT